MKIFNDLTGQRFGRWVVTSRGPKYSFWCQCECGNTKPVLTSSLRSGSSQSCGCLRNEMRTKINRPRANALLASQCLSLAEIARRLNCSIERVRQISLERGESGTERRINCVLDSAEDSIHTIPFVVAARESGCWVEPILQPKHNKAYQREYRVNGKRCLLLMAAVRPKRPRYRSLAPPRYRNEYHFVIYDLRDGTFLVLPHSNVPKRQTMFSPSLSNSRGVGITDAHRHDWRSFINAWDLLGSA